MSNEQTGRTGGCFPCGRFGQFGFKPARTDQNRGQSADAQLDLRSGSSFFYLPIRQGLIFFRSIWIIKDTGLGAISMLSCRTKNGGAGALPGLQQQRDHMLDLFGTRTVSHDEAGLAARFHGCSPTGPLNLNRRVSRALRLVRRPARWTTYWEAMHRQGRGACPCLCGKRSTCRLKTPPASSRYP